MSAVVKPEPNTPRGAARPSPAALNAAAASFAALTARLDYLNAEDTEPVSYTHLTLPTNREV